MLMFLQPIAKFSKTDENRSVIKQIFCDRRSGGKAEPSASVLSPNKKTNM